MCSKDSVDSGSIPDRSTNFHEGKDVGISKEELIEVLDRHQWVVEHATEEIGINMKNVYRWIKKYGLKRPEHFVKRSWNSGKTHCKRGHPYTLKNTINNKFGYRVCKTCAEMSPEERQNGTSLHVKKAPALRSMGTSKNAREIQDPVYRPVGRVESSVPRDSAEQCDVPCLPRSSHSTRTEEVS